jgi:hypothetical protein
MRYVILEHRQVGRLRHWDLLLEQPHGELRAWRLERCPPGRGWNTAVALADHRRRYLRYEGPISGSRGYVRQWDAGNFRTATNEKNVVRIHLNGRRLRGLLEMESRTVVFLRFGAPVDDVVDGGAAANAAGALWRYRFQFAAGTEPFGASE